MSIRIGILGYGNLGRGVECAIKHNPDMELVAVFTRRDPATVKILTDSASVYHVDEAEKMKDKIDVMILMPEYRNISQMLIKQHLKAII